MKYADAKSLTFIVSAASLALFTIRIFAPLHLHFSQANCPYQNIEDSKVKETQPITLYPFDKSLSVFLLLCCFASFIVSLSSGWRWPINDNYIELIQLSDSSTQLKPDKLFPFLLGKWWWWYTSIQIWIFHSILTLGL